MRRYLWLPFVVAVSVVPGSWASAASGAGADTSRNGQVVSPAESGLPGANGARVSPMTRGRAELNATHYQRRRPCYVSPRNVRTTFQGMGWCGGR